MNRNREIIAVSIKGIAVNLVLAAMKIFVGLLSNSIAIMLDAVNYIADATSSLVTIVGTLLSQRAADKKHPFGYGRIEYLSSIIISIFILLTGLTGLEQSVIKIFEPVDLDFSILTFFILGISTLGKFALGLYVKKAAHNLNAQSLSASAADSISDSFVSLATLISGLIFHFFRLNIDGYLGAIISVLIIKTGFDILKEGLGSIIGNRTASELIHKLEKTIKGFEGVEGAYDLILHDYGPVEMIGSIHIEVNDQMTARQIDKLSRDIIAKVFRKYGVLLTIGIYATNTFTEKLSKMKKSIREIVDNEPHVLNMHAFYVDEKEKFISFDVIIDFKSDFRQVIIDLKNKLHELYPDYSFIIYPDSDFSETD